MLLRLHEIPPEGVELDEALQIGDRDDGAGRRLVPRLLRLVGRAGRCSRGVDLQARLEGLLSLECARCLESFETRLDVRFALVVVGEAAEFGSTDKRLEPEEADLFYAAGEVLDLREVAREQVLLNLPLKPVCRPECAGLCPTCGANRNRIECACSAAEGDPQLAPLQAWKRRLGELATPPPPRADAPRADAGSTGNEDGEPET